MTVPAPPADAGARHSQISVFVHTKIKYLTKCKIMMIRNGEKTVDLEREYTRCIAWAHALNANDIPAANWPSAADDAKLLDAINAVDAYVAQSGAVNDLIKATTKLIAAYKAP